MIIQETKHDMRLAALEKGAALSKPLSRAINRAEVRARVHYIVRAKLFFSRPLTRPRASSKLIRLRAAAISLCFIFISLGHSSCSLSFLFLRWKFRLATI